jgi:hypothetical protein
MDIRQAAKDDLTSLLDMAASLWPDDMETETVVFFIKKLGQDDCEPAASRKPRRS